MDLFGNNFFKLNLMSQDTWKFPWTLSVTNFMDPFRKEFVSLNITGCMEISMDPLSKNIFELVSMLEGTVHGNFHRPFW